MAITFDGVDDVVNCGTSDVFTENGAITISFWFKPGTSATNARLVHRGTNSGPQFYLTGLGNDQLNLDIPGATTLTRITSTKITSAVWQNIILTWDGSTTAANVHIYINGTETSYDTTTNGLLPTDNSGATLYIANRSDGARAIGGIITEFAIWNVVLTAANIALLSSKVKGSPLLIPTGLVAYWGMNDGALKSSVDGQTVVDISGNGNNGTGDNGANNIGLLYDVEDCFLKSRRTISPLGGRINSRQVRCC